MSATELSGGCLCGAVRYRVAGPALATRVCWCRLCQYLGAGSGTVNACFPSAAFSLTGQLTDYKSIADSGNVTHRGFCRVCGTPVTSMSEARPHLVFVRVGTLDDPSAVRPEVTIWTSTAPEWALIDAHLPMVERQPPPVAAAK
jgi:hypothetical protein